jgi:hypothetical protein
MLNENKMTIFNNSSKGAVVGGEKQTGGENELLIIVEGVVK